ncbi:uncharacterized protein [Blastocystis hominis]|uniref:Nucleotide-diphospho-sugar transferase domain-containing protein n=1 Tax=Blastocystis hominis TaxID=12968 RepID=D8M5L6_BLAHO|nr:uncharacterized protein [Blastocystis hominis]CBK23355.2 unnamed protein product [Blastocystis hominis]|eukprot:XP_012897403.1 uncharacterized protein [Blastocystis hominis]
MFLNSYRVCGLQQYKNLIVTCFDKACYKRLKVSAESDKLVDTSTASSYGSRAFRNKVHWKLIMLQQAVNQNVRVLYMDSDNILFKDPFPVLNSYNGYDFIAQRDVDICTGFIYLMPTLMTKQLLAKTIEIRPKLLNADDQKAFNMVVQNNTSVKLLFLPDHLFSSGAVFFKKHSYYWDKIRETQIMMHDNFVIGIKNKIYRLKELKLYKLDVDGEYSNPDAKYLTIEKCNTLNELSLAVVLANRLNRSLIIPPFKCAKTRKFCTLCQFNPTHCGHHILKNARLPYKESVFFTNELVPKHIKIADQTENVISFSQNCTNNELLHSDFPPRANNTNHIECQKCSMKVIDCAYNYFRNKKTSVAKLHSFI